MYISLSFVAIKPQTCSGFSPALAFHLSLLALLVCSLATANIEGLNDLKSKGLCKMLGGTFEWEEENPLCTSMGNSIFPRIRRYTGTL
jgi:hypothetical protein